MNLPTPQAAGPNAATLSNGDGLVAELLDWGAAIKALWVPTAKGPVNVVLGYDDPVAYQNDRFFHGATVGRYAGRIASGRFCLNGKEQQILLDPEQGPHALHGGPKGFHARCWRSQADSPQRQRFTLTSTDGDQGFPGALDVCATYELAADALIIELSAVAHADTVINLTNHAYFNLAGDGDIRSHQVSVCADRYTPLDDEWIPTGQITDVADTPFDLRTAAPLGQRLNVLKTGFDHNFVLNKGGGPVYAYQGLNAELAASVTAPATGIRLQVFTTQPGLQFYTGRFLATPFLPFSGLCLEAQNFPNAPNQANFPSSTLAAGQSYRQLIVYQFQSLSA